MEKLNNSAMRDIAGGKTIAFRTWCGATITGNNVTAYIKLAAHNAWCVQCRARRAGNNKNYFKQLW